MNYKLHTDLDVVVIEQAGDQKCQSDLLFEGEDNVQRKGYKAETSAKRGLEEKEDEFDDGSFHHARLHLVTLRLTSKSHFQNPMRFDDLLRFGRVFPPF